MRTTIKGSQFRDDDLFPKDLASTNEEVNEYIPKYDSGSGKFTWIPVAHSIVDSAYHSDKGDFVDIPYSPTLLTGGVLSEGTNPGTLKISALTALIRTTDSTTGALTKITLIEQDNKTMASADTIYKVALDYNGGTPQILIQETSADGKRTINIGTCMKESDNTIHFTNGGFRFAEGIKKTHHRAGRLRDWEMSSTISIVDEGSKQFSIASGQFFKGINQIDFAGFDSSKTSPDTFTYVYYDGDATGGLEWKYIGNQTEIDVDNYNDVATGLDTVIKYKCDWVFVHPDDGHVYIVYGQDDDVLGNIIDSSVPTLPDLIDTFGTLIGRIIIDAGVATFYRIEMIQTSVFRPQVVIDHNDLSNKQGGTTDQFYHLTSADYTELSQWLDNVTLGSDGKLTLVSGTAINEFSIDGTLGDDSDDAVPTEKAVKTYVDGLIGIDNFTIKRSGGNLKIADRIEQNIMLLAFYRAVDNSKSIFNLLDGFIDEYEDETGVDTGISTNEDYDSTNDLYNPLTPVNLELDYMEYSTDELARVSWISSTPADDPTIDENTLLMLHLNNNVTDDGNGSVTGGHTVTNNNVTFDSETKKWGSHSGVFNGSTAYLSVPDSDDWDVFGSDSDNWTIDLWVKHDNHDGDECYITQRQDGDNVWMIRHSSGTGVQIWVFTGGSGIIEEVIVNGEITDTDWHHIAFIKVANKYGYYLDGNQVGYFTDNDTATNTGELHIGEHAGGDFFDGYMDEIRIQHSNIFNAIPNDTPDDTIDIPIAEYSTEEAVGSLSVYSEDTIKNQGSYSLKGIAEAVNSLNQTITKTLGTGNHLDLSSYDSIKLDVYASEVGTNLQIQIHDSGGTTSTKDITIDTGDEDSWVTITWDISGISSENKDDIDSIIIKIISSDTGTSDNTFYIDNVYAIGLTQNMILISNSQTAETSPSDARIIIFEEDVDNITLNTDIKLWGTRENGTGATWEQVTLTDEGNYEGSKRVLAGIVDLDVTGMGAGTDMAYKITTHNNKDLKIHGIAMNWD